MNRWASQPLRTSANDFLSAVRSEIPVSLIATARADLKCECNHRWQEVETNTGLADFDQVPLTDSEGLRIEGVFVRGKGRLELREDMFMAANAPLLSFLESADQHRFRFLLMDSTVSGMATISDIQKLPVYSVLFSLVVAVELLLTDWIRKRCCKNHDEWLLHLTKSQRGTVEKHWQNALKENLAIDRLSCAAFGQEIQASIGLGLFDNHDDQRTKLKALEQLRHQVCHATEFAPNLTKALRIPVNVRDAHSIAIWLQEQIAKQSTV
jgi:hypothetical protein